MADGKLTSLADPANAIASYLDELLHTATDQALQEKSVAETPEPEVKLRSEVRAAVGVEAEKVAEKTTPRPAERKVVSPVPAVEPPAVAKTPSVESRSEPDVGREPVAPPSRPEWSEKPFE
ncbi:MAG: chemotaxis protein CheW, partial [Marinobacter sp.]|nr:chemotaxis protein CheW [Marinobacter sp.]